jgi:hypothetical protein
VPEDSARPETQALVVLNRRKGFVGNFYNIRRWNFKGDIFTTFGVELKRLDPRLSTRGENYYLLKIDAETRRAEQKTGFDTLVSPPVNYEWKFFY